ncbi:MAG: hypothetical protein AAGI69_24120 [Cyanobacteria bacterium P01_H01_bin.21]
MLQQTIKFKLSLFIAFCLAALLFQGCKLQMWLPPRDMCLKNNIAVFRTCIEEKFPPGSNYFELETFLERKGFTKRNVEPVIEDEFDFVFYWKPLIAYISPGRSVSGQYDEDFNLIEVKVR